MNNSLRLLILLANDIAICLISLYFAFYLRQERWPSFEVLIEPAVVSSISYLIIFFSFGYQKQFIKYFNINYLNSYIRGFIIYTVLFTLVLFIYKFYTTPRSIGLIQPLIFFILLISGRFVAKNIIFFSKKDLTDSLLIYGDTQTFSSVLNERSDKFSNYILISNEVKYIGRNINGIKVNNFDYLENLPKNLKGLFIIQENLVDSLSFDLWNKLLKSKIRFMTVDLSKSTTAYKNVDYNKVIFHSTNHKKSFLKFYENKKILISGAGGSIGSCLSELLSKSKISKLLLLDNSELNLFNLKKKLKDNDNICSYNLLDVTDKNKLDKIIREFKPEVIIHAAAYKHVLFLENQPIDALRNNYLSTKNLLDLSIKYHIKNFLFISTDKAVRPTSIMGLSKRAAEILCLSYFNKKNLNINIVRFGNVINSSGSVIPIFLEQIINKKTITVTHKKVVRFFMSISEAVDLVLIANAFDKKGIYHLDMGKLRSIWELASNLVKLNGYNPVFNKKNLDNDSILIKEVGLLKGEKLYEEILLNKSDIKTSHPSIFKTSEEYSKKEIDTLLNLVNRYIKNQSIKDLNKIKLNDLIKFKK